MPLIYIILVNYNGYIDTIDCVESLRKIKYLNYKILIIDNASTNDSLNYIKQSLADCIIIESKQNLGFAGGNNIGIKYALENGADYVLLLNNDTIVENDFLDKLVEVAQKDNNIGVVGGKIYYHSNPKKIWYSGGKINKFTGSTKHLGVDETDKGQYDNLTYTEYVTGCMMLVSRKAIEKAGMMDEKYFLYYEETDWNIKIKNAGFKIIYTPYSKIYHKVSSSTQKLNESMGYYYDRNRYYFVMNNFKLKSKLCMYCYFRIILLLKYFKAILQNKEKKKQIIRYTFYSIKNNIMGELKL